MARCLRGGTEYKRHQYALSIIEVDGVTQSHIACKACGKVQTGSIIKFENVLDKGTEVL